MSGSPSQRSLRSGFEGDDARGQTTTTEEKLSRGGEPLGHHQFESVVINPVDGEKRARVHDGQRYRVLSLLLGVGQTVGVLDHRFVYVAMAASAYGGIRYIIATLRGQTAPNRVTWSLWAIAGILAFVVERQQHVGIVALMTLMLGLTPLAVFLASFKDRQAVWQLGPFDFFCGVLAIAGIVAWLFIHQATVALVSFTLADHLAGLPTIRKAWLAPESEHHIAFTMGTVNCAIAVLTVPAFTTANVLFPGSIAVVDALITALIVTRLGSRWRARNSAA